MEGVSAYVLRSSRWTALRHDRGYVADWRAHAGGPVPLEPAPFALRTQTRADLDAARWGLLAWEDPAVGMAASPFWVDAEMARGRLEETDDENPTSILALVDEAGARLTGLRLLDGVLVLRIARGRKAAQVRIVGSDTGDAARCCLVLLVRIDPMFPEDLARVGAVCSVVWPPTKRWAAGWRRAER